MRSNNRVVCDLNKAQWARYGYVNQHGDTMPVLPIGPSVHCLVFNPSDKHMIEECSMLEYATAHNLLDVWKPFVKFQFSANHSLTYTGDKAKTMWKEWGRRIFNKKGK
jgi:hypothetical protein